MRGSGRVKPARWKRSWFRVNQNPSHSESVVEVVVHREGELPSVMARPMSTLGARNSKDGKEIRVALKDHGKMIKMERKRLRTIITLQDTKDFYAIKHPERIAQ